MFSVVESAMKALFGKKGQMMGMMGPRKPISLVLGLVFLAFGLIPLLNSMKVIGFSIPTLPNIVLQVLGIIGAVILLWDAISEGMTAMMGFPQMIRMATFVMALLLLAIGLIPLLNSMNVIGFGLPALAAVIVDVLYVVTGALLLYGGTQGF
ncbi:hypothetical protein HYV83_01710 [Candidatus Woesearchaeota archaeon]|nr:hypothetical protein [Candidatus Woesearchaeota archaeon]